jgi:hypothetical protein
MSETGAAGAPKRIDNATKKVMKRDCIAAWQICIMMMYSRTTAILCFSLLLRRGFP